MIFKVTFHRFRLIEVITWSAFWLLPLSCIERASPAHWLLLAAWGAGFFILGATWCYYLVMLVFFHSVLWRRS